MDSNFLHFLSTDPPTSASIARTPARNGSQFYEIGDSVKITCYADSNPPAKYTIYKDQVILVNNSLDGAFVIRNITANDGGVYSCMPSNRIGMGPLESISVKIHGERFILF